jgi:hypothetical protein
MELFLFLGIVVVEKEQTIVRWKLFLLWLNIRQL